MQMIKLVKVVILYSLLSVNGIYLVIGNIKT